MKPFKLCVVNRVNKKDALYDKNKNLYCLGSILEKFNDEYFIFK